MNDLLARVASVSNEVAKKSSIISYDDESQGQLISRCEKRMAQRAFR
jgi:hypothetical protein